MKSINKQSNRKAAFTIIELLTVMSIIVIIISLLVPSLNMARRFAKKLTQKNQLHVIGVSIEFFNSEFDGYPPSGALDGAGQPYCGAMKLCEAMMGRDLLGFHPDSAFRADGQDFTSTRSIYLPTAENLNARIPFLQLDNANAYRMLDIYGAGQTTPFLENSFVLCDVYTREMRSGKKTGMPVLYYKAETTNNLHDPNAAPTLQDNMGNIYNYWDNHVLVNLGKSWEDPGKSSPHSLSEPVRFYRNTRNVKLPTARRPYRAEEYILISAGYEWKYRE